MLMKYPLLALIAAGIILLAGCVSDQNPSDAALLLDDKVVQYKSSSCGCCGGHASYLKGKGFDIEDVPTEDMGAIKERYGVPRNLESCHTEIIGGYFVEGHMPIEAIEKLLSERPDIRGIALPGMPSGSPGMPGPKTEPWTIYAVNKDGSVGEFMVV